MLPLVLERPAQHPAGRSAVLATLDHRAALVGGQGTDPGEQDLARPRERSPRIVGRLLDRLDRVVESIHRANDRMEIGPLRAGDMNEDLRRRAALAGRPGTETGRLPTRSLDQLLARPLRPA